jgi:glycerophosphoryl diester phosphodiesterase
MYDESRDMNCEKNDGQRWTVGPPAMDYCFRIFILLIPIILAMGCNTELSVIEPQFGRESLLVNGVSVDAAVKKRITGIYSVEQGSAAFGKTVVLKWNGDILSIFCEKNAAYVITKGLRTDSTILFEGYWRYAQSSETGLIRLRIGPADGARMLLGSTGDSTAIVLRGLMGTDQDAPDRPVVLRYQRPPAAKADEFLIVAHRGGGRNSDRLPFSENSVPLLLFAQKLGANGVEIDVRMTRDNVPILYHDEEFNTRLIKGDYLVGPVSNYRFDQIRTYGRLINGETIPTLDEALDAIVTRTGLRFVWLDIKSAASLDRIMSIQRQYMEKAAQLGRTIEILIGLPDEDIYNAYVAHPNASKSPSLCELSPDQVRHANASVWGPRWTLGTVLNDVRQLHAEGRRVVVWTVDLPTFIRTYLDEGEFDGMLTNYPTLVAYNHFSSEK